MWKRLDESIALSEKLASLSWPALGTWVYLLSQTDTMGRFHRDPRIIKAKCMTMRYELRLELVEETLLEIERAGLFHCFDVEGKRYLVLHDYRDYNPPGALGRVSPKYPAPPPGVCKCCDEERRASGVRTPDVTSTSSLTSSSPPDVPPIAGVDLELPDSPESRIVRLLLRQKVIYGGERQLRTHVGGWIADKGFQFVEALAMNEAIRGKDVFWIHDTYFKAPKNGKGSPGAKRKVANPDCLSCKGSGRKKNPTTGLDMACACVREVAV